MKYPHRQKLLEQGFGMGVVGAENAGSCHTAGSKRELSRRTAGRRLTDSLVGSERSRARISCRFCRSPHDGYAAAHGFVSHVAGEGDVDEVFTKDHGRSCY